MITVKYELSYEARKAELAAGRSGEQVRFLVLEAPYPAEVLKHARIGKDGHGWLDLTEWRGLQVSERIEFAGAYWEKNHSVSGHGQGTWFEVSNDYQGIYFPAPLTVDFLIDLLLERAALRAVLEMQEPLPPDEVVSEGWP